MAQESPLDVQTLLESIAPAVYKPKPNDPRDPIPQDDRKKGRQLVGADRLMQQYLPELAAEKERLTVAAQSDPLLDFVMKLTGAFTGPSDKASGVAGMLGPIGRATTASGLTPSAVKAINQAQKKIVKSAAKTDPATLQEVVASPRMLHVGVPGAGGAGLPRQNQQQLMDAAMEGAYALFQPGGRLGGTMRVHPAVMKGITPQGNIMQKQGIEGLGDMVIHEMTHFLNDPNFAKMQAGQPAATSRLAGALQPFTSQAKFGPKIVGQWQARGRPEVAANEALSYLSQPSGRSPAATWLQQALTGRAREGGIGQFDQPTQSLLQEVLEAAMNVPGATR